MNAAICSVGARHEERSPVSHPAQATEHQPLAVCELLVEPWYVERSSLLSLCLRWTSGNLAEAEDLLGDVCLRILEGGEREGVVIASPSAFWATAINNLGRDRARRTRRWKFDRAGNDLDFLGRLPAQTISAEQQVFLNECLVATGRKLARLNERQRAAVLLRSGGLDYPGIGDSLCTSAVNARKLVQTARKLLNTPRRCKRTRAPSRSRATGFRARKPHFFVLES
jgi:DNA-directed RNA polymerase specialized sigma24 family protein